MANEDNDENDELDDLFRFVRKVFAPMVLTGTAFIYSIYITGNYLETKEALNSSDGKEQTITKIVRDNYKLLSEHYRNKELKDSAYFPRIDIERTWDDLPKPGHSGMIKRINLSNGHVWKDSVYVDSDSTIFRKQEPLFFEGEIKHFEYVRNLALKRYERRR